MELTFTQAAKGVNKEIAISLEDTCQRCDGRGHEPGTKAQRCQQCNGSGMVSHPPFSSIQGCAALGDTVDVFLLIYLREVCKSSG